MAFAAGETRNLPLQDHMVRVRCREIRRNEVVLEVDGLISFITLNVGEEKSLP